MANSIGKVQIDFVAGLDNITSGVSGIAKQIEGLEKTAARTAKSIETSFASVQKVIGTIAVGAVVRGVVQLADSFQNINARLKIATEGGRDFQSTFREVFDIAQRTSTSLESTSALYGRLSKSLSSIGRDGKEAGGVVETINQTLALSGATAASSSAAITQLNQALASGVLRGEEFNSVNEQAPELLEAIGRATGKTIGQLRSLATEGKLTAEVVIDALQAQAPRIAEQYAQLPLTVGRAFQKLKNEVLLAVGELDQSTGVTKALAGAIGLLADNIKLLGGVALAGLAGRLAGATAAFIGTTLAARAAAVEMGIKLPAATAVASASLLKLVGGPFGALITVIGLVSLAVEPLSGLFEATGEAISDALFGVTSTATEAAAALGKIAEAQRLAASGNISVSGFRKEYDDLSAAVIKAAGALNQARTEVEIIERLKDRADRVYQPFDETRLEAARARVDELQAEVRRLIGAQIDARRTTEEMSAAFERQLAAVSTAEKALSGLSDLTSQFADEQKRLQKEIVRAQSGDAAARQFQIQEDRAKALKATFSDSIPALKKFELQFRAAMSSVDAAKLSKEIAEQEAKLKALQAAGRADADAKKALAKETREAEKSARQYAATLEKQLNLTEELLKKELAQLRAQTASDSKFAELLADQNRQIELLQVHGAARDELIAQFKREDAVLSTLGVRYSDMTEKQKADYDIRLANLKLGDQIIKDYEKQSEAVEKLTALYNEVSAAASDAIGQFATEALTNFDNIGDAFDNLGDSLGDIAKRAIAQVISEFARLKVINPILNQLLGTSLQTGSAGSIIGALGGQNGIGSLLGQGGNGIIGSIGGLIGSLFGGGGAAAGGVGTIGGGLFQMAANGYGAAAGGGSGSVFGTGGGAAGAGGSASSGVGSLAGAASFIGGAYGVYSAFRAGKPVSGAASGAVAGSVFGPVGTIVGGIVGALAGILGGPKPPDIRLGGIGVTRKPEETFSTALGQFQIGVRGGVNSEEFQKLVASFDEQLAAIVGSFKDGETQLGEVQSALATFAIDLKGDAVTVENVLGARFNAILATFDDDIKAFVGTAGTLEERVQKLADAGFIQAAQEADKLVGTFGGLASVLYEQQIAGEDLQTTYARVFGATALLTDAAELTGVAFSDSREDFVNFATDIVDAAGGLQRATELWQAYYATFYSDTERANAQISAATARLTKELADIGLDPTTTKEQFRALFESVLPTLSPEQIAQYLEAAQAFGILDQAIGEVKESVEEITPILIRSAEDLAAAANTYADFAQSIRDQITDLGATEFQRQLADIEAEFRDNVNTANELAIAAGRSGAAEQDLVAIHELAARRVAAAVAQLRQRIQGLVTQLYSPLDRVNRLIEEANSTQVDAVNAVSEASNDRYAQELAALKQIRGFLDSLLLDTSLTTLTPRERLGEAQSQFAALLAAAQGGDTEALQQLTGAAQAYLREARSFFASGSEYTQIFDFVTQALAGLGPTQTPNAGTTGGGSFTQSGLTQLEIERDRLTAEQERLQRQALALELVGFLRELATVTGDNILELAESFGVPLDQLVADLGVSLEDVTAATAVSLASIAQSLGIELTDLASSVGVDLGNLADDQSLLNDALESVIAGLPDASAGALAPLLQNLEDATTEADANEALAELTLAAAAQPAAIRAQLEPFLDDLDALSDLSDLDYLSVVSAKTTETSDNTYAVVGLLTEIRGLLTVPPPIPIVPPEPEPGNAAAAATTASGALISGKLDKMATEIAGLKLAQQSTAQAVRLQTDQLARSR